MSGSDGVQAENPAPGLVMVEVGLPIIGGGPGRPSEARLHLEHYVRLEAIHAAAKSGNYLLLRLALEHQNKFGTGPEKAAP